MAFVVGVVALVALAVFAVSYIHSVNREWAMADVLGETDGLLGQINKKKVEADGARKEALADLQEGKFDAARTLYTKARSGYTWVLTRATELKGKIDDCVRRYGDSDRLLAAQKQMNELVMGAKLALDSDELRRGVEAGKYIVYEGEWVTPAQKALRVEEQLKKELALRQAAAAAAAEERKKREQELAAAAAEERKRREQELAAAALEAERQKKADLYEPTKDVWVIDDFEKGIRWQLADWGNPSTLAAVTRKGSTQMEVKVQKGTQDKWAIQCPIGRDLSNRTSISFSIENTARSSAAIAIALDTTAFFESRQKGVPSGVSEITFDLTSPDFKCEASKWQHTSKLKGLDYVHRVYLIIYKSSEATFYVDNVVANRAK